MLPNSRFNSEDPLNRASSSRKGSESRSSSQLLRKMRRPAAEIFELESEYPYCKIPPHFFERRLAALEGSNPGKSALVVEITRA